MTVFEVDQHFGMTPCLCGSVETWHPKCYAGKSQKEIDAGMKRVYALLRSMLSKERTAKARAASSAALRQMTLGKSSHK